MLHQRQLANPDIGLSQLNPVPLGESNQPHARAMHQLGVCRERHRLRLHCGSTMTLAKSVSLAASVLSLGHSARRHVRDRSAAAIGGVRLDGAGDLHDRVRRRGDPAGGGRGGLHRLFAQAISGPLADRRHRPDRLAGRAATCLACCGYPKGQFLAASGTV
jgi:hypothetical protein